MAYTELQGKKEKVYYYRVKSIREGKKVSKKRIYLGSNLTRSQLKTQEEKADIKLSLLSTLLSKEEITLLEKIKKDYLSQPKESLENRYESFCSLFTYNSTAIEGNTLTLQETAQLLFEHIAPSKSLREIHESINHKEALDFILATKKELSKELILSLYRVVIKNTLKPELESQLGVYRELQVYIRGSELIPPKPGEVPREMKTLLFWYSSNKTILHPVILAAYFHSAFEGIHPFIDGNGRVGRLIMNFILHKHNYPMINIPNSKKSAYYSALQEAQVKNNLKPFITFLISLLKEERIRF